MRQKQPIRYIRVNEARETYGVGRTKLYQLMNARTIKSSKIGRSRLLSIESLEMFFENSAT